MRKSIIVQLPCYAFSLPSRYRSFHKCFRSYFVSNSPYLSTKWTFWGINLRFRCQMNKKGKNGILLSFWLCALCRYLKISWHHFVVEVSILTPYFFNWPPKQKLWPQNVHYLTKRVKLNSKCCTNYILLINLYWSPCMFIFFIIYCAEHAEFATKKYVKGTPWAQS